MTELVWDQLGGRIFEAGLDRGVLYFPEGGAVAWNGLTSIDERISSTVEPVYFDGVKFNDIVTVGDFSAVMNAYTYPEEFLRFEGVLEDQTGVYIAAQPQRTFHLSYRTKIGNDVDGLDAGYKIHILYNLTAIPAQKSYVTLSIDPELIEFQWSLTATPEEIEGYKPTAHIIIDSRDMDEWLLADLEDVLYGSDSREPSLPTLKGLTTFIRKWNRLIITDNGDGTWSAYSSYDDFFEMIDETTFQISVDTAVYIDADTYEISSTEKNEDDLWLP